MKILEKDIKYLREGINHLPLIAVRILEIMSIKIVLKEFTHNCITPSTMGY